MKRSLTALACLLFATTPALAGVSKLSSPDITAGKLKLEYSGVRYGDDDDKSQNNAQSHGYEYEYDVSDRWKVGMDMKSERKSGNGHNLTGVGIEGQYQFTKQRDWWLSSALKMQYAKATQSGDADELDARLLVARNWGDTSMLANFNFSRELGSDRQGGIGLETKLRLSQKMHPYANPGVGGTAISVASARLGDNDGREYHLGPVVSGDLLTLEKGKVGYNLGYFWGLSRDSSDNAARIQLSYEHNF